MSGRPPTLPGHGPLRSSAAHGDLDLQMHVLPTVTTSCVLCRAPAASRYRSPGCCNSSPQAAANLGTFYLPVSNKTQDKPRHGSQSAGPCKRGGGHAAGSRLQTLGKLFAAEAARKLKMPLLSIDVFRRLYVVSKRRTLQSMSAGRECKRTLGVPHWLSQPKVTQLQAGSRSLTDTDKWHGMAWLLRIMLCYRG